MFTQKISMDCTQEQYEKYLKTELEKMGYERADDFNSMPFNGILTGWNDDYIIQSYNKGGRENDSRTYLGKFNAPLFLALAAMTDREYGNYGEWCVRKKDGKWEKSVVTRGDEDDYINPYWRKATVSEIMAKFGEQPKRVLVGMCGKYTFDLDFPNLSRCPLNDSKLDIEKAQEQLEKEGKEYFSKIANREANNSKAISEIAKSWSSLMDAMDEYHIESLKSKGYRIFKQTTTLEEV